MLLSCSPSQTAVGRDSAAGGTSPAAPEASAAPEAPAAATAAPPLFVAPDDPAVAYDGVWFPKVDAEKAVLLRHSDECIADPDCMPEWLKQYGIHNQHAGVVIRFRTDAPSAVALVEESPVTPKDQRRYPFMQLGLYVDGVYMGQKEPAERVLEGTGRTELPLGEAGTMRTVELALPHQLAVVFRGLELPAGSRLEKAAPLDKPVYLAIGNSLSHGEGQLNASETFPWILALEMGWELVNLSIGGTTIEPKIVTMNVSPERRVDVATVEWGYNDWWSQNFTLEESAPRFAETLRALRAAQPKAKIYVITPFATETVRGDASERDGEAKDGSTLADWRAMMRHAVEAMRSEGDASVFCIEGDQVSTVDDLDHRDGVHFTPAGARTVAGRLKEIIGL